MFPRQELPLRVFEPRYKQLVDDCMLGDGQFGVCLIDETNSVSGWNSPKLVGTIAKITKCQDVELDGLQLHIETCLLYTSPSPRDGLLSRMPSSA